MYVVFSGLTGRCGDFEFIGGSAVYDPEGRPLARLGDEEGLAIAELDTERGRPDPGDAHDDRRPPADAGGAHLQLIGDPALEVPALGRVVGQRRWPVVRRPRRLELAGPRQQLGPGRVQQVEVVEPLDGVRAAAARRAGRRPRPTATARLSRTTADPVSASSWA